MKKLAICGCSFASDFDSHSSDHDCDFNNEQLWSHRLHKELGFNEYKVFGAPGSSMFKIFLQVEEALEKNYSHILILLTSPYRVNFFESGDQEVPIKSRIGSDNAGSPDVKDLVKTIFYDETYYKKMSEIIAYTMYNLCNERFKNAHIFKFQIYKNLFYDCNYSENYNDWGPCQILKEKYGHPTSPNHLGVQGQDIVLEKFTKDLESWKYD
jgi:hypothetical protein